MSDIVQDDYCYKDDHVDDCHIVIEVIMFIISDSSCRRAPM